MTSSNLSDSDDIVDETVVDERWLRGIHQRRQTQHRDCSGPTSHAGVYNYNDAEQYWLVDPQKRNDISEGGCLVEGT